MIEGFGEAEIEHLGVTLWINLTISRLEVAMDDSFVVCCQHPRFALEASQPRSESLFLQRGVTGCRVT